MRVFDSDLEYDCWQSSVLELQNHYNKIETWKQTNLTREINYLWAASCGEILVWSRENRDKEAKQEIMCYWEWDV